MTETVQQRIAALQSAERDYETGLRHSWGDQRLEISRRLGRIRRQIKMLTEADRTPSHTKRAR